MLFAHTTEDTSERERDERESCKQCPLTTMSQRLGEVLPGILLYRLLWFIYISPFMYICTHENQPIPKTPFPNLKPSFST